MVGSLGLYALWLHIGDGEQWYAHRIVVVGESRRPLFSVSLRLTRASLAGAPSAPLRPRLHVLYAPLRPRRLRQEAEMLSRPGIQILRATQAAPPPSRSWNAVKTWHFGSRRPLRATKATPPPSRKLDSNQDLAFTRGSDRVPPHQAWTFGASRR